MWHKPDRRHDLVVILPCNALRDRSINLLHSIRIPALSEHRGCFRSLRKQDNPRSSPPQPVNRVRIRKLLLHQPQQRVLHKTATRQRRQPTRFVHSHQMRIIQQHLELLRSSGLKPRRTVPHQRLPSSKHLAAISNNAVHRDLTATQLPPPLLFTGVRINPRQMCQQRPALIFRANNRRIRIAPIQHGSQSTHLPQRPPR